MIVISEYTKTRPRNEDGSFIANSKIYDWLLKFQSVKSWINAYTTPATRRNYLLGTLQTPRLRPRSDP